MTFTMSDLYYVRDRGRILGPYDLDVMRQLIGRSQVGRSHELSLDSQSWRPASSFMELFEQGKKKDGELLTDGPRWHYTAKGIEQPGPIDHQSLLNLIAAGHVGPLDKVWNESMPDWAVVCQLPELAATVLPPIEAPAVKRRSPLEWWLRGWRNYADFESRACREEFWYFALFTVLLGCVAFMLDLGLRTIDSGSGVGLFHTLNTAVTLVPNVAVTTRRLHDTDRSGWWQLLAFVPVVGAILLLVWLATDGDPRDNRYGPDPKGRARGGAFA